MGTMKALGVWGLLTLAGCAGSKSESKTPVASERASAADAGTASDACGSGAANTPAHCACLGGYVRGDIGDGKVACPQGETELERVQQGIEGAVCCKAMVQ